MATLFGAQDRLNQLLQESQARRAQQQQQLAKQAMMLAETPQQAGVNAVGATFGAGLGQGLAQGLFGEPDIIKQARGQVEQEGALREKLANLDMTDPQQIGVLSRELIKVPGLEKQGLALGQQAIDLAEIERKKELTAKETKTRDKLSATAVKANKPILAELVKNPNYSLGDFQKAMVAKPETPNLDRYAIVTTANDGTQTVVGYTNVGKGEKLPNLPEGQQYTTIGTGRQSPLVSVDTGEKSTPFQTKLDEKFAPVVVDWKTRGASDMAAQQAALAPVLSALENGEDLTGLITGSTPDLVLAVVNPTALDARQTVEGVVQRSLKTILGSQFTEKEGERLIQRAYDPKLSPELNAKRVRRLFNQITIAANQLNEMSDYAIETGSLKGYKGDIPSLSDFYGAIDSVRPTEKTKQTSSEQPSTVPNMTPNAVSIMEEIKNRRK